MAAFGWFVNLMQLAPRLEPITLSIVLIAALGLASLVWSKKPMAKTQDKLSVIILQPAPEVQISLLDRLAVAARLGCSKRSLELMVKRGEFPQPIRIGKRATRWQAETVDAWIAERETAAQKK